MLNVAVAGLGYFSQFHLAAWQKNEHAHLVGVCDPDETQLAPHQNVAKAASLDKLLQGVPADIVDIIAPPHAHAALIRTSLAKGRTIICQKPFATSPAEALALTEEAEAAGSTLVIHENFRFQPWYRTLKAFLNSGQMGQVYQIHFALRPGDGRGPDAYLSRQPFFQQMPRLLIHETAVHFIDLFQWLLGDIESVYADLRQLNPVIAGEDAGHMILHHASGARSVFDGNRLADNGAENPRKTMGVMTLEGEGGTVTLTAEGILNFRNFGSQDFEIIANMFPVDDNSFGGGCVGALIDHVVATRLAGTRPENTAREYLKVVTACEAAYQSAKEGRRIDL